MVLPLVAFLERVDPTLLEAGAFTARRGRPSEGDRNVGAPGVMVGTLLTFIPAAGTTSTPSCSPEHSTKMVGNVIDAQFFRAWSATRSPPRCPSP